MRSYYQWDVTLAPFAGPLRTCARLLDEVPAQRAVRKALYPHILGLDRRMSKVLRHRVMIPSIDALVRFLEPRFEEPLKMYLATRGRIDIWHWFAPLGSAAFVEFDEWIAQAIEIVIASPSVQALQNIWKLGHDGRPKYVSLY